jgi:hypothetical protein
MERIVTAFHNECAYQLANGRSVSNHYFSVQPKISGVFDSSRAAKLESGKHKLGFSFRKQRGFTRLLEKIKVQLDGPASTDAYIASIFDTTSQSTDGVLSPGGAVRLTGWKIKVCGTHQDVGLYFVNSRDNNHKVKLESSFLDNTQGKLSFVAPPLAAGNWLIELVTQYAGGKHLFKEPRTIRSPFVLSVAA